MTGRDWALAVCAALFVAGPASAQDLFIGAVQHDTEIGQSRIESGTDMNAEWRGAAFVLPEPVPDRLAAVHPFLGYSGGVRGDRTDQVYGGVATDLLPNSRYAVALGVGLALHDGPRDRDDCDRLALGQPLLLYASLEAGRWWDRHGLFAFYQHSSNGPFGGPNDGLNNLGVRYGYRY